MSQLDSLQTDSINAIRFLSADAIQKANSGHPGLPMGAAAMAYTLWVNHMRHAPKYPDWPGRDRFILSGGHGSMLLYSLLYLCGYDLDLDELKRFRQWGTRTPGHPEFGLTPGVEVTSGPLGQGFSNGVGMAIAIEHMAASFNRPGFELFDQYVYGIVTDGDLMEGITSEAASLAGHLALGRLIYLYDDNHISIDGSTELAFTEDRMARFASYRWHVQTVSDGNDTQAIDDAIRVAKMDPRPSIIAVRTQIGFGLPTRQGTSKAHGEPPGEEELAGAKRNLGWPVAPDFYVPDEVLAHFRQSVARGASLREDWLGLLNEYRSARPEMGSELDRRWRGEFPADWEAELPIFDTDEKGMATRNASSKVLNALALKLPELIGGSADLAPSTKTWIENSPSFQAGSYQGRNFNFGVREHGMGAVINGMALFGGIIPYGATFLVFSDYMRGAVRLSALSHYPSIWVYTHDSIGVGEDGPTHQPVEHLAALRAIPGLYVIRPGDANEVREAWKVAVGRKDGPTALVFSRQNVPILDRNRYASSAGLRKGAYVMTDMGEGKPEIILMASGTEVSLICEAGQQLLAGGINVRLVSFPSWELFAQQSKEYRNSVLPPEIYRRLAVEAGVSQGWHRWVGDQGVILSVDKYGSSAPYKTVYEKYGLTVQKILDRARTLL